MGAVVTKTFVVLLLACTALWGGLALYYTADALLAAAFGFVGLVAIVGMFVPRWRTRLLVVYLAVFVGLLAWWNTIKPSNARHWQPDVAVLPYATIDGSKVTIHNIRNFDYRSETDFDVAYYDKTYDLSRLESADLVASYWMGPAIAHTFVSFGFSDGEHLAVSIETRKEQGEGYSSIKGFFKQYELYYVVADERDVIRVRTNFRENPPEDVYLYRLETPVENVRMIFLQYLEAINALTTEPEWYNTLTTNCTTAIWMHSRINPNHVPLSWKILASGYVPEYLYDMGRLDNGQSFDALRRAAHINGRAQKADGTADFSRRIRAVETVPVLPHCATSLGLQAGEG